MTDQPATGSSPRRYRWPWFVLGFFLLGVTLTVVAVRREAQRVKEQRAPWVQESDSMPTNPPR